jgi:two-component system nitrogen regulation response regulator GlnG
MEMNRNVRGVTDDAMELLKNRRWYGNVRELENHVKRAMILSREDVLPKYLFETDDIGLGPDSDTINEDIARIVRQRLEKALSLPGKEENLFENIVGIIERSLIMEALGKTNGNQMRAASLLDMNRSTLRKKMKDFGL